MADVEEKPECAVPTVVDEYRYIQKLRSVVGVSFRFPSGPSKIFDHLYIGCESDATNFQLLNKLGVTHIINCAAGYTKTGSHFYGDKCKYLEFNAEDEMDYNIMQHVDVIYEFIENARVTGGNCLIHCLMGINRSGALAVAYVMLHKKIGPITATRIVRKVRSSLLTNQGFQVQLIRLANQRGLLELDKNELPKL